MKTDHGLRVRTLACLLIIAAAFAAPAVAADATPSDAGPASAPPAVSNADVEAVHNQLRALRDAILDAWKRRDIDAVLSYADPDIVVTWQNGEVNRGPQAVKAFYEAMLEGDGSALSDIASTLTVDDLSILHGQDTAVALGSIHDDITFKRPVAAAAVIGAGKTISLDSRWTATLVRKGGEWKLASYHVSANLFSNPVTDLATKAAGRLGGIIGFGSGAILVLLVVWIRHARSKRTAAASP